MINEMNMDRVRFIANDPASPPAARRHAQLLLARERGNEDPYQSMSLEAAATEITPDPDLRSQSPPRPMKEIVEGLRGAPLPGGRESQGRIHMTPEEIANAFAESDAEIRSRRPAAQAPAGPDPRMLFIDGVSVPEIETPDGRRWYSLRDIRLAQEAERESKRLALVREANQADMQQFGYGPGEPTEDQLRNREGRHARERTEAAGGVALRRRVLDLAARMGVSEDKAYEAYMKAAAAMSQGDTDLVGAGGRVAGDAIPVDGIGHARHALVAGDGLLTPAGIGSALDAARRELASGGATDAKMAQKQRARGIITRREQMQRNPLELLGDPDLNDWQRMFLARRLVGSSGFTPIEMQARQNEGLQRLGERYLQGGGGRPLDPAQAAAMDAARRAQENQLPPEQQAGLHVNDEAVHPSEMAAAEDYVSQRYSSSMGWFGTTSHFSIAEQQATIDYLVNVKKYTLEKAQRIVDDIAKKRSGQSLSNWLFGQVPVEEAAPRVPRVPDHQSM
jgi:hypothetical protein